MKFRLIPRSAGLIRIHYAMTGESAKNFMSIPDKFVFVAPFDKSQKINQIPDEDYLSKQCHKMKLDQCSNGKKLELLSSCRWESSGTMGYQSVSVDDLRIPLSIGGIKFPAQGLSSWMYTTKGHLTVSKELNSALKSGPKICGNDKACKDSSFTAAEHQFLIKQNIFARSHFKALANMIPKWLSIDVQYGYTGFHISNLQSIVLKSYNMKQLRICENFPKNIMPAVYTTQLLFMPVIVKAHALEKSLDSSSPICLATDLCKTTTFVSLPKDKGINVTSELQSYGIQSIGLEIHGFGFNKNSSIKRECYNVDGSSKECFDSNIWLKMAATIKKELIDVSLEGEAYLRSEDLENVSI